MGSVKRFMEGIWTLSPQKTWKYLNNSDYYGLKKKEYKRIKKMPTKKTNVIEFLNKQITIIDSSSFLYMYDEIFRKEIYCFETENKAPYIIDCGANIGLSIIYFNSLFPGAKICGFEPDPDSFSALSKNIAQFNFSSIEIYNSGIAGEEGERLFLPDHSDGGHFTSQPLEGAIKCKTINLCNYINGPVDFLKLDIEGCETEVIQSLEGKLPLIQRIFIEYHSFRNTPQNLDVILNILTKHGFRYYIQSVFERKHPFGNGNKSGAMDMQLNIFAIR